MMTTISLPHFIVKKSRTWYCNVISGDYIHKDKIEAYLKKRREKAKQTKLELK